MLNEPISNQVTLYLPSIADDLDVTEMSGIEVNGYSLSVIKPKPRPPNTGGLAGDDIVIFVAVAIASGFFGAIGQDAYNWVKEKLFRLKEKLHRQAQREFTINVSVSTPSMMFFQLTELGEEEFYEALNHLHKALHNNLSEVERDPAFYVLKYDRAKHEWIMVKHWLEMGK